MYKKKRALYNLVVGMGSKIILMALGFLVPKLYIENYGSEVNGLLSSISQVFTYLALLEAGVGTATTQALYDPIAHNDQKRINGIMSAASSFYRRTGVLYGLGVVIFAVIYALTVSGNVEKTTVVMLILLSGANGVLNYFFQAKYLAMLNAEGKGYVHVAIGTAVSLLTTISKLILLYNKFDIVFVYTVYFVLALIQNIAIGIYIHTHYKSLRCNSEPDFEAISQSKSVLVHQISSLIFSNTDVLILTFFCDLNTVSIYVIYNMVVESIAAILNIVIGSFTAALGLTYQESKERFAEYFDMFELGTWIISFIVMTITLLLYNPFIAIYTAKADIQYVDKWLPGLFVLCKLLSLLRMPGVNAVNVAGHFQKTQMRSIIESVINLVVSLVAVNVCGIYGVLFGTLAALSYRTVDFIVYTNKKIVYRSPGNIIKRILVNAIVMILVVGGFQHIINVVDVPTFVITGVILSLVVSVVFLFANFISERNNPNIASTLKKLRKNNG
jgi:O-antigen/teichoic acid export membrane protein